MTSPIQPRYISHKANAPIELARSPVEVVGGGATLQADGTAFLRLMARDRVIVTARFRDLVGALLGVTGVGGSLTEPDHHNACAATLFPGFGRRPFVV